MRSRWLIAALSLLCATPAVAGTLSMLGGPGIHLLPNTPNQQVVLMLSGADEYTNLILQTMINDGVGIAPRVTGVFNSGMMFTPSENLVGSLWEGGVGGATDLWTAPGGPGTGLNVLATYRTVNWTPQNTAGVAAVLTFDTQGYTIPPLGPGQAPTVVPPILAGEFTLSFEFSYLVYRVLPDLTPHEIVAMDFAPATIVVAPVPEPSTYVPAAFGVATLLAIRRRKLSA